jgi:hypothetical protein
MNQYIRFIYLDWALDARMNHNWQDKLQPTWRRNKNCGTASRWNTVSWICSDWIHKTVWLVRIRTHPAKVTALRKIFPKFTNEFPISWVRKFQNKWWGPETLSCRCLVFSRYILVCAILKYEACREGPEKMIMLVFCLEWVRTGTFFY